MATSPELGTAASPSRDGCPISTAWSRSSPATSAGRELSGVFLFAIVAGIAYHVFVNRTRAGYDLRVSGYNPGRRGQAAYRRSEMIIAAMLLSGAMAGLVGMLEILQPPLPFDADFPDSASPASRWP